MCKWNSCLYTKDQSFPLYWWRNPRSSRGHDLIDKRHSLPIKTKCKTWKQTRTIIELKNSDRSISRGSSINRPLIQNDHNSADSRTTATYRNLKKSTSSSITSSNASGKNKNQRGAPPRNDETSDVFTKLTPTLPPKPETITTTVQKAKSSFKLFEQFDYLGRRTFWRYHRLASTAKTSKESWNEGENKSDAQICPRTKSCQNSVYYCGRFHHLLVAVLHSISFYGPVSKVFKEPRSGFLFNYVDRSLEQHAESPDLLPILQGLQESLQTNSDVHKREENPDNQDTASTNVSSNDPENTGDTKDYILILRHFRFNHMLIISKSWPVPAQDVENQ